jgi:hypothetical protein
VIEIPESFGELSEKGVADTKHTPQTDASILTYWDKVKKKEFIETFREEFGFGHPDMIRARYHKLKKLKATVKNIEKLHEDGKV